MVVEVLVVASFIIALGFGIVAPVLPAYAKSFDVGTFADDHRRVLLAGELAGLIPFSRRDGDVGAGQQAADPAADATRDWKHRLSDLPVGATLGFTREGGITRARLRRLTAGHDRLLLASEDDEGREAWVDTDVVARMLAEGNAWVVAGGQRAPTGERATRIAGPSTVRAASTRWPVDSNPSCASILASVAGVLLEEYLAGPEVSVECVVLDGQAVADSWFTGFRGDVAAAAMSEGGGRGGEAAGPIVVDVLKAGG